MGRAALDPAVNRYSMVIVNGAADSLDAPAWTAATSPAYDRIKVARLAPLGEESTDNRRLFGALKGVLTTKGDMFSTGHSWDAES